MNFRVNAPGKKPNLVTILASAIVWGAFANAAMAQSIDPATITAWSAPYRNWYYQPDHVISSAPKIAGYEDFKNTDVPTVYQLPGETDKWYMSFIGFNGHGYNSFVAESADLVKWSNPKLAMGFGNKGEFDYAGRVVGGFLFESYDIKAPRVLKQKDGKYWTLYGAYPQPGYETRPGYEGIASSADGLTWHRAQETPALSIHDSDVGVWENDCIYQPWLVESNGAYYDFYNAAHGANEQSGIATSTDLFHWNRTPDNPAIANGNSDFDTIMASDPKVFRDDDHWTMFYFGLGGNGHANIMAAFSTDLLHWTASPEPLYVAGGNPSGLDAEHAHKISLVYNPANDTFYMYYCAVGNAGRGIGLITSKPLFVPEPNALSLLGAGLPALGAYLRHHRQ